MADINTVGIIGGEDANDYTEVLTALALSCGLILRRARMTEGSGLGGFIMLDRNGEQARAKALGARPSIRIITLPATKTAAAVRFGTGPSSPLPFRGRSVLTRSVVPSDPQDVLGEVIATADGTPVWTTSSEGGPRHDVCWVPHPWIKRGECVFEHLSGDRFMSLLPLLEWFRWISGWSDWIRPPLRACFMFDDPNLHARRYGFVDFDHLAAEGKRNNYHTSFATVPLDSYYVSSAAARIIRDNSQTLSLLIHGNNHTYRELAGRQAPGTQLALMQQAIYRTCRLERKAGVAVSRVMAPPHGVCSTAMMSAIKSAGIEAICVSHGSVWTGNPGAEWAVSLGALPAMVVAGLPVLPRFGLDHKSENNILLAAYLDQPIILVGHHWKLAEGTDILSALARFINGIGRVAWSNMTAITRNNYRFRVQGQVMRVQTFSRITTVKVPEDVSELELEASWLDPLRETIECRSCAQGIEQVLQDIPSAAVRFSVTPGSNIQLVAVQSPHQGEEPYSLPGTPLRMIARRVLTEFRDRSMPYIPKCLVKQ